MTHEGSRSTRARRLRRPGADGQAAGAVKRVLDQPWLALVGLHCQLGSQLTDAELYGEAIRQMIALMAEVRDRHQVVLSELNLGGGQFFAIVDYGQIDIAERVVGQAESVRREARELPDHLGRVRGWQQTDAPRDETSRETHREAVSIGADVEHVLTGGQALRQVLGVG